MQSRNKSKSFVPFSVFSTFMAFPPLPLCQLQLALASGTCHPPLPGLNHVLLQLLTSNTPWRSPEWRAETRHSVFWENWQGRSSNRYSWELILWAQFLYLLISRKALKSFMCNNCFLWLEEVSQDQQKFSTKKYVLDCKCTPPLPESHIHCPPCPLPLWSSFSELSEVLSPRPQSSYCLK